MTPQELKNSILQWAVQGKLVPQDPTDEPAKILLEKIKAEKAELIKQKKIKAGITSTIFRGEDNLFYETVGTTTTCIQDEIPFDIPDSWEWVRLREICIINPRNAGDDNIDAGFMPMTLLKEGYNSAHQFTIRKWKEIKSGFTHFANNDIVVAKITPCFQNRKSAIIANLPNNIGAGTTELHVIRVLHETVILQYILWFVKTSYFIDNGVKAFTGTAGQQRIGADYITNVLIPLPPLAEQKRIVEKIERLMPIIDEYGTAYTALQDLQKAFPENLKKSLLQWAVQGKLVPQDPNDEPAKILLEKIKAEKIKLSQNAPAPKDPVEQDGQKTLRQKKSKIDKASSTIFRGEDKLFYETTGTTTTCIQDEIPFDIPDSWEWVTLENIFIFIDYRGITPNKISKGIPLVTAKNIKKGYTDYKIQDFISEEDYAKRQTRGISQKGDLLFTTEAPLGNIAIADLETFSVGQRLITLKSISNILNNKLLMYFILSDFFQKQLLTKSTGTTVKGIKAEKLKKLFIPIPPLAEQKRITEKLQTLMPLCTELENKKNNFYNT